MLLLLLLINLIIKLIISIGFNFHRAAPARADVGNEDEVVHLDRARAEPVAAHPLDRREELEQADQVPDPRRICLNKYSRLEGLEGDHFSCIPTSLLGK